MTTTRAVLLTRFQFINALILTNKSPTNSPLGAETIKRDLLVAYSFDPGLNPVVDTHIPRLTKEVLAKMESEGHEKGEYSPLIEVARTLANSGSNHVTLANADLFCVGATYDNGEPSRMCKLVAMVNDDGLPTITKGFVPLDVVKQIFPDRDGEELYEFNDVDVELTDSDLAFAAQLQADRDTIPAFNVGPKPDRQSQMRAAIASLLGDIFGKRKGGSLIEKARREHPDVPCLETKADEDSEYIPATSTLFGRHAFVGADGKRRGCRHTKLFHLDEPTFERYEKPNDDGFVGAWKVKSGAFAEGGDGEFMFTVFTDYVFPVYDEGDITPQGKVAIPGAVWKAIEADSENRYEPEAIIKGIEAAGDYNQANGIPTEREEVLERVLN